MAKRVQRAAGEVNRVAVDRVKVRVNEAISAGVTPHWYEDYGVALGLFAKYVGLTAQQAVKIFALMSPQMRPVRNWDLMVKAVANPDTCGALQRQIDVAKRILAGEEVTLTGLKVVPFEQCLLGNLSVACIDRWAARTVYGDRSLGNEGKGKGVSAAMTVECQAVFVVAAGELGMAVAVVQELAWVGEQMAAGAVTVEAAGFYEVQAARRAGRAPVVTPEMVTPRVAKHPKAPKYRQAAIAARRALQSA